MHLWLLTIREDKNLLFAVLLPLTIGVTKVVYSVYVFVCLSVSVHMGVSPIQGLGPGPAPPYKLVQFGTQCTGTLSHPCLLPFATKLWPR